MIQNTLIHEPMYPFIKPDPLELELFNSKAVRRLKQLAHFGAGSIVSSVVHTRFEHTVGVWKLAAYFFPNNRLLRAAAILHDIGHLPFSHSVEKTLGFNHHQLTEKIILGDEIRSILKMAELDAHEIIDFLDRPSVLTGMENILGLDHLDSFLRDTYMSGELDHLPKQLLQKIRCTTKGIETDKDTGLYLMKLIQKDHEHFLSPIMVAVDRLLAEAVTMHWESIGEDNQKDIFPRLTDADVLTMLTSSPAQETRKILHTLHYEPYKIQFTEGNGNGIPISIRKIYAKVPLVDGEPLTAISEEARRIIEGLNDLTFDLEVFID